ncbi:hypothetical protein GCM10009691_30500 [Brevibacterium picturae]|uniref:Uncharacterized protein n=1 Tax=Brevibacterium picturae TaxID=260553 RepID=A0ABN2CCW1_9MICO
MDAIKAIATELGEIGGMLLLVGAWAGDSDLLDDPQIRGRLSLSELNVYAIRTNADKSLWQKLLKSWESALEPYLPDTPRSALSRDYARYLYERTQGYVGDLAKCLARATATAIADGRCQLEAEDLVAARLSQRARDHEGSSDSVAHRPESKRASRSRDVG